MDLSAYRQCAGPQRREAVGAFWRGDRVGRAEIDTAALSYGPLAVLLCVVVAVELVVIAAIVQIYGAWWAPLIWGLAGGGVWASWFGTHQLRRLRALEVLATADGG